MADKKPLIKGSTNVPQQLPAADTLLVPDNIKIEDRILLKELSSSPSLTAGYGSIYTKDNGHLYYKDSSGVECQICIKQQSFISSVYIGTIANQDYDIGINLPFAGAIKSITTKAVSGTCTLTGKINGTPLGGTANAVSTSEQAQAHASANAFAIGGDFILTASSNSACLGVSVTIEYERTIVYVNPSTGTVKHCMTIFKNTVADETIPLFKNSPFAGTITKITTKAVSGTATVTGEINTTALGGTANSASSTETEQAHSSANVFSIGDDVDIVYSANSSCLGLAVTVEYERESECAGITDTRYGTIAIASPNSSVAVTFDVAMADANYVVAIEVPYQTSFWVTSKTSAGFTINVGTVPGYSEVIGWSVRPFL